MPLTKRVWTALPTPVREFVDRRIRSIGYAPATAPEPVDFRNVVMNPLDAVQRSSGAPVIVEMPLAKCRGMGALAMPCDAGAQHPYVQTAHYVLHTDRPTYERSPMYRFHEAWRPTTLADLFDPGGISVAAEQDDYRCAAMPWAGVPGPLLRQRLVRAVADEIAAFIEEAGEFADWPDLRGRAIDSRIVHFCRLIDTLRSIRAHGYRPGDGIDGHIRASLLVREDASVAFVLAGQHRIAALGALGALRAPIRLEPPVVRREDAAGWPAVRAGVFTEAKALEIFDRIFGGRPPSALAAVWPSAERCAAAV